MWLAGSTYAIAVWTDRTTVAIISVSRWQRSTGRGRPWHDVQLRVQGPAVADIETVFRERWEDPARLTRNPIDLISDVLRGEESSCGVLPPQLPDPPARGSQHVQVLRTYPRRRPGYPFAPHGERSVAHAYEKVVGRAQSLIYLEDQYLWATDVVRCFADALRANQQLRLIAVVPLHPDQDGRLSKPRISSAANRR
jgi:phosphatidylserine/phosphatidylglycerophosphate/cardiolipin synthase-like enzyme